MVAVTVPIPLSLARDIMMAMDGISAIVFDVSGTLLDDIQAVWQANSAAYREVGLNGFGTLQEFRDNFSLPVPAFHRRNGVPPHLIKELEMKFREVYPRYVSLIDIFPDVRAALDDLKARQISLGVASNIPSRFLREHLAQFGIDGFFAAVVGQEDCDEQKPSPKPILRALSHMGVSPQEAMYVGDMEEDLMAAKAAKTRATAITRDQGYHPRWRLEKHAPDYFIETLADLVR